MRRAAGGSGGLPVPTSPNVPPRRSLEAELRSYVGSDPLEPWDRWVRGAARAGLRRLAVPDAAPAPSPRRYARWLEGCLPAPERRARLPGLLERLVAEFLPAGRYRRDPRFVGYCLKLVGAGGRGAHPP